MRSSNSELAETRRIAANRRRGVWAQQLCPSFFMNTPLPTYLQMTTPKPTEDLNVVSIWSKISTKERDALKAVADQREQTISQLIRFCLKEQGCLG